METKDTLAGKGVSRGGVVSNLENAVHCTTTEQTSGGWWVPSPSLSPWEVTLQPRQGREEPCADGLELENWRQPALRRTAEDTAGEVHVHVHTPAIHS